MESIQKAIGIAEHTKTTMERYSNDAIGKKKAKPGIDVVLGSQWGDEGKGKLVDMLSQVFFSFTFCQIHPSFISFFQRSLFSFHPTHLVGI